MLRQDRETPKLQIEIKTKSHVKSLKRLFTQVSSKILICIFDRFLFGQSDEKKSDKKKKNRVEIFLVPVKMNPKRTSFQDNLEN